MVLALRAAPIPDQNQVEVVASLSVSSLGEVLPRNSSRPGPALKPSLNRRVDKSPTLWTVEIPGSLTILERLLSSSPALRFQARPDPLLFYINHFSLDDLLKPIYSLHPLNFLPARQFILLATADYCSATNTLDLSHIFNTNDFSRR